MKKPTWLRKRLFLSKESEETERMIAELELHTVCSSALCPNRSECFGRKRATFMILGNVCTRRCAFCGVSKGTPWPPDAGEPERIAAALNRLKIEYAVITSVTRDDLPDRGSAAFAATISAVKKAGPETKVEVLTPDFGGERRFVADVIKEGPLVFNHNLETVSRLYPTVRPQAGYQRSLGVLRAAKEAGAAFTKSGLMLGLGEEKEEVIEALCDLKAAGCDIVTLGQYLRPTRANIPVARFVSPDEFEEFRMEALEAGFKACASGPFVRSSYFAEDLFGSIKPADKKFTAGWPSAII